MLRLRTCTSRSATPQVLRGIDLEVGEHEVVALIGASGSGKSTLLRTVNLLERIDDGQVWLRDLDVSDPRWMPTACARASAWCSSTTTCSRTSPCSTTSRSPPATSSSSRQADAEARGRELLDRIGLGEHAASYPDRLSGGQQQRAAIVRAIATEPELLLLDEITSALDPELVGEVLDLVRQLKLDGTTIVMATHEMAFARDVADRVVFLDQGVIVEQGPPAQVFGAPRNERTKEFLRRVS